MSDSDDMGDEEKAAQVRLDELCKENDIPRFLISAKKAPWKKLVMSMCGISENKTPKKRGAKPREQEQIDAFLQSMMCFLLWKMPIKTISNTKANALANLSKAPKA
jgi:hypothetical protein